jgi:hypothetical protein
MTAKKLKNTATHPNLFPLQGEVLTPRQRREGRGLRQHVPKKHPGTPLASTLDGRDGARSYVPVSACVVAPPRSRLKVQLMFQMGLRIQAPARRTRKNTRRNCLSCHNRLNEISTIDGKRQPPGSPPRPAVTLKHVGKLLVILDPHIGLRRQAQNQATQMG